MRCNQLSLAQIVLAIQYPKRHQLHLSEADGRWHWNDDLRVIARYLGKVGCSQVRSHYQLVHVVVGWTVPEGGGIGLCGAGGNCVCCHYQWVWWGMRGWLLQRDGMFQMKENLIERVNWCEDMYYQLWAPRRRWALLPGLWMFLGLGRQSLMRGYPRWT